MTEEAKRWIRTGIISIFILGISLTYLYYSRGEINLNILNKAFGQSAAVIAAFTLVLGPLSKKFLFFTRYMTIRRHLGLSAFGFLLLHIIASLAQTDRFPLFAWYLEEWIPVLFGIIAAGLWVYMVSISRNIKIRQMGADRWKRHLSLAGNVAFIAIFLHITIMKYPIWLRFYNTMFGQVTGENTVSAPPASLLVGVIMFIVILYRIVLHFRYKKVREVKYGFTTNK